MSKSPDAFRTISEVADWLGVQAHVLRFWESRFAQVKPVKRAGGRRYYRPNDMRLLGGIKKLLHEDGITIKGVQRILREQGVAHVAALSPDIDVSAESPQTPQDVVVSFPPKSTGQQIDLDLQVRVPTDAGKLALSLEAAGFDVKPPVTTQYDAKTFDSILEATWIGPIEQSPTRDGLSVRIAIRKEVAG